MDPSPKGREIRHVEGTPADIIERGQDIHDLGGMMLDCAATLKQIKNQALDNGGQKGKAIEKLRETIGDSHTVLRQAGELYEPVGPVIKQYGQSLETLKPRIDSDADECVEKWAIYDSQEGNKDGSLVPEADGGFLGMGGHDADSPEAKQEAEANQAAKRAYDDWLVYAESFDDGYDSWESAFEEAANGVTNEMAGTIEDSVWSTITGWLEIAALVVGIAALIIGGPIAAAIALAVGAALLVTTIVSYTQGERGKWDIALAAVGVIPFGKVSGLTKLSHLSKANASKSAIVKSASGLGQLDGLTKASKDLVKNGKLFHADGLVGIFKNRGAASGFRKLTLGAEEGFTSISRTHKSFYQGPGRILANHRASDFTTAMAGVDYGTGIISNGLYHVGNVEKVGDLATDGRLPTLPALPKPIQFAL